MIEEEEEIIDWTPKPKVIYVSFSQKKKTTKIHKEVHKEFRLVQKHKCAIVSKMIMEDNYEKRKETETSANC